MQNEFFSIYFNHNGGNIEALTNPKDEHKMNWFAKDWCIEYGNGVGSGLLKYNNASTAEPLYTGNKSRSVMPLKSFDEGVSDCTAIYENSDLRVTVYRFFSDSGSYCERYTVKNLRDTDFFLEHGDLDIIMPFNDVYTYADDCMINRCNTHIWCGGNTAYVNALRMGSSEINLGMVLTKGAIKSYSVESPKTNYRGIFILNFDHMELLPNEEYVLEWEFFWHKGSSDFYRKAYAYPSFINIEASHFTVFEDEQIEFAVKTQNTDEIKILYDGNSVDYKKCKNGCRVTFSPRKTGEHRFDIYVGALKTYTEFFVAEKTESLIKKRIDYIIKNQQYLREGSHLHGAFLIYDTKEKEKVFDSVFRDHNACRERTGMALLITKYLQTHNDDNVKKALDKYIEFVMREVFDRETGEIYDGLRKSVKRLYNAPWITTLFTEMYFLTKDTEYLNYIIKILKHYYSVGGEKFYPNGLSMRKTISAFYEANMKAEGDTVKNWYISHTDNMVASSLSYPKHEVNFEQTIVSPAATFISEIAFITGDGHYKAEALKHIKILERFNGHQPSYHLNEIPIRFWDDRWFGKSRLFGDTFPHYWSCLTARAFMAYYSCSGDEAYRLAALQCARNCLCLFNDRGEGSCAYVYPFKINDIKGEFYDEWANDQDFALYFYLVINEIQSSCCTNGKASASLT